MRFAPGATIARRVTALRDDPLRRGSLVLMANAIMLATLGLVFWVAAARLYEEAALGILAGVAAGAGLLSTIAALGLQNTLMRHLSTSEHARELAATGLAAILVLGSALILVFVLIFGGLLPAELNLQSGGPEGISMVALALLASLGGAIEGGLVALRSTGLVVRKNFVGAIVRLGALFVFAYAGFLGDLGLIVAYTIGALLSAVIGATMLWRQLGGGRPRLGGLSLLRKYVSFSLGSHAGVILGVLPATVVALMVLGVRGPVEAAWYASASMIAAVIAFVPSTTCQALFAEVGRTTGNIDGHIVKATRHIYMLVTPAVLLTIAIAPWALSAFGSSYAEGATDVLRLLALAALLTSGGYIIDTLLNARDHVAAYVVMNGVNAALVLGAVWFLLPYGLAAGAAGWLLAQAASLIFGLILLSITGIWRVSSARISPVLGNLAAVAVLVVVGYGGWIAVAATTDGPTQAAAVPSSSAESVQATTEPEPEEPSPTDRGNEAPADENSAAPEPDPEPTPLAAAEPAPAPPAPKNAAPAATIKAPTGVATAVPRGPGFELVKLLERGEKERAEEAEASPAEPPTPAPPAATQARNSRPAPAPAPRQTQPARPAPAPRPAPQPTPRPAPAPAPAPKPAPKPAPRPAPVPATAGGVLAPPAAPDAPPG